MIIKIIEVSSYFIATIVIALFANRKKAKTFDSYILANREFSRIFIGVTLIGTWIGGGTLIGLAGKISTNGLSFIFVPLGVSAGFLILGLFSKYYRRQNEEESVSAKTIVERLAKQYGEGIRFPCFIVISIIMILFMSVQLYAGAKLIGSKLDIDPFLTIILFGLLTVGYTFLGGTRGDVMTDIFQVAIIYITLIVGLIFLIFRIDLGSTLQNIKSVDPNLLNVLNLGLVFLIGSIILPTLTIHTDAGIQHKLLIARSDYDAKKGSYLAGILYFIFGIVLIAVILLSLSTGTISRDDKVMFSIFEKLLPGPFMFFFSLALLSAVLSTLDSELLLVSALFVNDFFVPLMKKKDIIIKENTQYKVARMWVLFCFISALAFAFLIGTLFEVISALWVISLSCLGLPLLGLVWRWLGKKIYDKFVLYQIIWSAAIIVIIIFIPHKPEVDITSRLVSAGMGVVFLNFVVLIISSLLKNKKKLS
jgi:Na+/proline symporter